MPDLAAAREREEQARKQFLAAYWQIGRAAFEGWPQEKRVKARDALMASDTAWGAAIQRVLELGG